MVPLLTLICLGSAQKLPKIFLAVTSGRVWHCFKWWTHTHHPPPPPPPNSFLIQVLLPHLTDEEAETQRGSPLGISVGEGM